MSTIKKLSIIERLKHARRVSVPLVAINTADPAATIVQVANAVNGGPVIVWDSIRGVKGLNAPGKDIASEINQNDTTGDGGSTVFLKCLAAVQTGRILAFMLNADHYLQDKFFLQAAWNVRDEFQAVGSMLVMLGPNFNFPPHLQNDVIVLDEELPDAEQLLKIVREIDSAATTCGRCAGTGEDKGIRCEKCSGTGKLPRKPLTDETANTAVEAALGLPSFTARNAVAMAIRPGGKEKGKELPTIDLDHLWSTKKSIISQVPGLTVESQNLTFDSIGGLDQIRDFTTKLFSGPYPPSLVVQLAEIEKAMSGTGGGDLSGTSDDQLGVLLEAMENEGWGGLVAYGPPGTGKSLLTKAMANSFGRLSLVLDLGACKGSLVGESEAKIRAAVKTIKAIGGSKVFFVATANKLSIKPELMRRFRFGTYFFDLPSASERKAIWKIQRKAWGIDPADQQPPDEGWSGSDIRCVCELAHTMGLPMDDVLKFAASNSKTNPEIVRTARESANGRYLSASFPGVYQMPEKATQRMISE